MPQFFPSLFFFSFPSYNSLQHNFQPREQIHLSTQPNHIWIQWNPYNFTNTHTHTQDAMPKMLKSTYHPCQEWFELGFGIDIFYCISNGISIKLNIFSWVVCSLSWNQTNNSKCVLEIQILCVVITPKRFDGAFFWKKSFFIIDENCTCVSRLWSKPENWYRHTKYWWIKSRNEFTSWKPTTFCSVVNTNTNIRIRIWIITNTHWSCKFID